MGQSLLAADVSSCSVFLRCATAALKVSTFFCICSMALLVPLFFARALMTASSLGYNALSMLCNSFGSSSRSPCASYNTRSMYAFRPPVGQLFAITSSHLSQKIFIYGQFVCNHVQILLQPLPYIHISANVPWSPHLHPRGPLHVVGGVREIHVRLHIVLTVPNRVPLPPWLHHLRFAVIGI